MGAGRRSMLYGTLLLTVTGLVSQLLGFFYRILLSRLIGAEVMGLYQLIMPVYSVLMSVTAVGLTAAVSNLTSGFEALGNRRAALQVLKRCLALLAGLLAVPALCVIAFSDGISVHLLGDARTQLGLVLLLPCVLLTGIENLHKHAFYGAGQVRPPAFTEIAEQVIRTVAVLGLLVIFLPQNPEKTVALIVIGMVLCEVFSSITLALLHRRWQGRSQTPMGAGLPRALLGRRIAHIAVPIGFTALLGNLMGSLCAVLIPQKLVAGGMAVSEAIARFGVMFGMTLPLLALPTAFIAALGLVLMPKLAESTALGHTKQVNGHISKAMQGTSLLMLPTMGLVVVLGPTLGASLFCNERVGDYLALLSIGMALSCYQSIFSCALSGVGKQPTAARNALICGAVELAITFFSVGIPSVGLAGYVWGFNVSALLGVILGGAGLCRATGLRLQLFQWLTAPTLAALLMALCTNLLFQHLQSQGIASLAATAFCLPFAAILYLAALQAQGVHTGHMSHLIGRVWKSFDNN